MHNYPNGLLLYSGPYLWIDNLGMSKGTLEYFKEYFEDPAILTTWHNFSFDRHVMYNMGIDVQVFLDFLCIFSAPNEF